MKKFYAIILALALVLGLSTAAFAATESFAASVKLEYLVSAGGFTPTNTATVLVDYTKTFSDDISAGLVGKINFAAGVVEIVDTYGWIKISNILGMFTLTAATAKVDATGGNILGALALGAGPGIYLDANLDPLFATFTMNNNGFGLKGTYVDEVFGIGVAYVDEGDYGFGVWGSLTLPPFGVKAEYDYNDDWGTYAAFIEGTYANADLGLAVTVGYEDNDNWEFDAAWAADKPNPWDGFVLPTDHFTMVDWYMDSHNEYMYDEDASNIYGSLSAVIVPELLTATVKANYMQDDDEFSVSGNLAVTPTPELTCNVGGGYAVDEPMWGEFYKVYGNVAYAITPALILSANAGYYYSDFGGGDGFKIGAGAKYNFIAGVDGYVTFTYYDETWHGTDGWEVAIGVTATL